MSQEIKRYRLRELMPSTAMLFLSDVVVDAADHDRAIARLTAENEQRRLHGVALETKLHQETGRMTTDLLAAQAERDAALALLLEWYPGCGLTARQTADLRSKTDAILASHAQGGEHA